MDELVNALTATGYPFAHYAWSKAPDGDYGTYSEYAENDLWADGSAQDNTLVCLVNFYTRDDTDTPRKRIQAAFGAADASWELDNVAFESESGLIHYTWTLEFPEAANG